MENDLKKETETRKAYEKQHREMMKLLNIPEEQRCFSNILPAIKQLKESNCSMHEQIEVNH